MNVNLDRSRRSRFSIGAVMLLIAGIALVLAVFRSTYGPIVVLGLGGLVAVVGVPTLTYRGVRWLNRRLIADRSNKPPAWRRAIEVGVLIGWGFFLFIFTLHFGITIAFAGAMALLWLQGRFE